ncbi:MAG: hypothetical protein B7Y05_05980 [Polynucleobacter sp. 24-46-87]|nr:MAG: hypothetical protein B7Y67_08330 [Polynucleobacter sp. 35-46-11]OZA14883.1 MAG: hypothetical protein B7Y05_05980 [Polynucleobacter sp. 24-46-87]OZA76516.1 MAG: hypothetical protein B7X71_08100 [Polynucleobacter sp. 39-46-10]
MEAKLNLVVLSSILALTVVGKLTNPKFINVILLMADELPSELSLLFITIQTGVFTQLKTNYLFAMLIVIFGFVSIANGHGKYREFQR